MWCRPRFFAEFAWRGRKEPQKNCKLLLSTLRDKPVNFRIGSTDINRPAPTLVILCCFVTTLLIKLKM